MCFWFFKKKKVKKESNETKEIESSVVEETVVEETPTKKDVSEETLKEEPVKKATGKKAKKEPAPVEESEALESPKPSEEKVAKGKYEVFPLGDVYMYRLKASNGEILIYSEIYKSKNAALNAIEVVKKNIEAGHTDVYEDKHNLFQFKLLAANKRILAVSSNYGTRKACESAANSFKKFAFVSPVVELDEVPDHVVEEIPYDANADKEGGKVVLEKFENSYFYQFYANNGVVLCSSIDYASKKTAVESIEAFKLACNEGKFFLFKDKKGLFQYKLYSKEGRCLAFGETYADKARTLSAAQSLASFVDKATFVDNTLVAKE